MNKYEISVNNAVLMAEGLNDLFAMKNLCLFKEIGERIDFVRTNEDPPRNFAWIYKVELNGQITLAYVKRVKGGDAQ